MHLTLGRKIILLVMVVLFLLVALAAAFMDYWVHREVDERLDAELAAADTVATAFLKNRAERLSALTAATAGAARFRAAIEETDRQTILDTGTDEMKRVGADLLLVTDGQGAELARVAPGPLPDAKPIVSAALASKPALDLWVVAGRLYQVACQPIIYGTGKPSGTLAFGHRVDDEAARTIATMTSTEVVVELDGQPVAASLDPGLARGAAADARQAPPGLARRVRVEGRLYKVRVRPLDDQAGQPVARIALARSLDDALAYLGNIQWSLLVACGVVAALGLGLSTLLGRRITTPLESLMRSTQELAAGRYDVPVRVETDDEIGLLAQRFEEMRGSLDANIRKLVEEERMRGQMEVERLRALSQMVAGVAHEINTPLGIVNQAASILTETLNPESVAEMAKDEDAATNLTDLVEAAKLIQANIARADQLIQSFKNLSVRQVTDKKETVDLRQLVDEILSLFAIRAKQAKLAVSVEDTLGAERTWTGYPGYLSQVLMNLLTNVERYAYPAGQGGPVIVELAPADLAGVPAYRVTVRDRGAGIPPENLSKVFEVFFTTGRGRGGSGLGLAIADNLVRSGLSGTIKVESTPGEGAAFHMIVPRTVTGDLA